MKDVLKVGTSEIMVNLRRNKRSKRLTLRVSSVDGKPVLTLPSRVSMREAQKFLNTQESWLREHLDAAPTRIIVQPGVPIPFQDDRLIVAEHSKSRVALAPGHILTPRGKHTGKSVAGFLKSRARIAVMDHCAHYSEKLGRDYGSISLRDPRSRWGSCSSAGNLMFSWRLILAPSEVLEYVVAHEIAHLSEMNHSPAFWHEVAELMPDYKHPQNWLKQNGAILHRLDFKSGLT